MSTSSTWRVRLNRCNSEKSEVLNLGSVAGGTLPKTLTIPEHVRRIVLSSNELKKFPTLLKNANTIEDISLSDNNIEILPSWISSLENLKSINLTKNSISCLIGEIGKLKKLEDVFAGHNELDQIEPELFDSKSIKLLYVHNNNLGHLPDEIEKCQSIKMVTFGSNNFSEIPEKLLKLKKIERLEFSYNSISVIPDDVFRLKNLASLELMGNKISEIGEGISKLKKLKSLMLNSNMLTSLPKELSNIRGLEELSISENPLPRAIYDSYGSGNLSSLRAYLSSLSGNTSRIYEAKLLVTGEGKVGKSWALSALSGCDPTKNVGDDNTTWGIDRGVVEIEHPREKGETIFLNSWDFGGQKIYRVTHQFFFSEQAIYLLVWNPRSGAEQCRVREWLRTIALRTGTRAHFTGGEDAEPVPRAKVIMVATHAKDRGGSYVADYGFGALEDDLKSLIVDNIEIDSRTGHNVDRLRAMIAKHAAKLPEMGQVANDKWVATREQTLSMKNDNPKISFARFSEICVTNGITDAEQQRALAWIYLHCLGRAIWYGRGDGEDEHFVSLLLSETIILDAVWLSRAFVQVLEHPATVAAGGMLDHKLLKEIWTSHERKEWQVYSVEEYEILKQVMRRFDVALPTRESDGRRSLVPQLVPISPPDNVPWHNIQDALGQRSIRMRCDLNYEAQGLMARIIAATEPWHLYENGSGLFWERGVFLRDTASFHNDASVTLVGTDRPQIHIVVSGERPEFFMHEIYRTLESVMGFWKGMTRSYWVGCPGTDENGYHCDGNFSYDSIVRRLREQINSDFNCQNCDRDWSVNQLISGFEPMLVQRDYMVGHLYHRDQILAPRICLFEPEDDGWLSVTGWSGLVGKKFRVTLVSELSGIIVASESFRLQKRWIKWIRPVARLASIALTGMAIPADAELSGALGEQRDVLERLGELPSPTGNSENDLSAMISGRDARDLRLDAEDIANFAKFLTAIGLDPRSHGMDIACAPDGRWLWMTAAEVEIYRPQLSH